MNIFSKMRITHKISALMIALVMGFILIGITYYIQINISESSRANEKDAFVFQQRLSELKQFEVNLRFQTKQIEALSSRVAIEQAEVLRKNIEKKIAEIRGLEAAREHLPVLKRFDAAFEQYNLALVNKIDALSDAKSNQSGETRNHIDQRFENIETQLRASVSVETLEAFAALKFSINAYISDATEASRKSAQEHSQSFANSLDSDTELNLSQEQKQALQADISALNSTALTLVEEVYNANTQLAKHQNELEKNSNQLVSDAEKSLDLAFEKTSDIEQATQAAVTAIIFFVAMGTAIGIYLIYKSIVFPMVHIQNVIGRINRGKTKARVKILTNDEIADLGRAFNKLFDERINQLESSSLENEKLNNSIISLIQALGAIARKDLTIKVPVSADITGTISDAVNLLTAETATTLHEVKSVSREVNDASEQLQEQSKLVMQFAESERMQIIATSKALKILASAMTEVAQESESADKSANEVMERTQAARNAVIESVDGIRTIRETISETEKRTKRLGERSQEISGIVNLINTIAERTHILALNASMHAASAGEAGKGFAVVAEEVQRLAENARQSTDEIAAMVNNMRVETSDTVTIMNKLIAEVAEESKLAEHAGEEMEATQRATEELVSSVKKIASQAVQQATVANRVKDRTTIIRNFTDKTEKQLKEQKVHTENLSSYAQSLVESVEVFKLPQDQEADTNNNTKVSQLKSAV